MHILVTNDDGILSPGLLALANAMKPLGKVTVLAPDRNWTASGHVKTLERPLRVREAALFDGSAALSTDGAPSDCVALALLGVLPEKVDLVVAGVNPGENVGHDVTYSGTVAAAMESAVNGVPGIAVSLASYHDWDFALAAEFAARLATRVLEKGIAPDVLLNVNVPSVARERVRGIAVTRLGKRIYRDKLIERQDPFGRSYYWIGGDEPTGRAEEGTDIWAIANEFISITPMQMDLTDYAEIDRLKGWGLSL